MTRVIKGWLLPNVGFKFRVDRPDGCGDMGVGFGGLRGGVIARGGCGLFGQMCLGWRETCVCRDVLKKKMAILHLRRAARQHTADKNNMRRALCAASVFAARGARRMFAARLIRMGLTPRL